MIAFLANLPVYVACGAAALGAVILLVNVYLTFIRAPLLRARSPGVNVRNVSGIPVFGSVFSFIALNAHSTPKVVWWLALVGLLFDPCGLPFRLAWLTIDTLRFPKRDKPF